MPVPIKVSVYGRPEWEADSDGHVYHDGVEVVGHMNHGYIHAGSYGKRAELVCTAWHGPNPPGKDRVRHLNDIRLDDRPCNLAWGDHSDDALDAYRNGNRQPQPGEKNGQSKLIEAEVLEIRRLYATGEYSYWTLGYIYGVHRITIRDIIKRDTWRHI